jgi:hypothetical protein
LAVGCSNDDTSSDVPDAALDAAADTTSDTSVDATGPEDSADHADAGPDADAGPGDADAKAEDADAAAPDADGGTIPDDTFPDAAPDAPDGDAGCAPPLVLRYESAGCGAAAHPVCGYADQDACAISVCSCDGRQIVKCDYASEPWQTVGCGDASSDAQGD